MYLGTYGIDEYLPIPAVTHRFSSGAAYAPTAIAYSIYEEGSTTGIAEDTDMTPASPFDSITGLYYARVQLTAAAGYEANKTYVVVVKATVDSVAAIDAHVFQIRPLQTGDSYALANGASGFVAIKGDTAAILLDTGTDGVVVAAASKTGYSLTATTGLGNQTANITGNLSGSVGSVTGAVGSVTGAVGSVTGAVGSVTGNVGGNVTGSIGSLAAQAKADVNAEADTAISDAGIVTHLTDLKGATFNGATDSNEAIRNRGDAAWVTATGFSTIDAAGIRTAVGLAAANLDTQLEDLPTNAELSAATIARVTLVDTTTTNTDMRGTDNAATAAVCTETRLSELDAGTVGKAAHQIDIIQTDTTTDIPALIGALPSAAAVKTAMEAAGSHLTLIKAVTDALTSAAAGKLAASAGTIVTGTVEAGTLSTTQATTDLTLTDADQLNGRVIIFRNDTTTAGLRYQATAITDFVAAGGLLTYTAITQAPQAGDTFVVV